MRTFPTYLTRFRTVVGEIIHIVFPAIARSDQLNLNHRIIKEMETYKELQQKLKQYRDEYDIPLEVRLNASYAFLLSEKQRVMDVLVSRYYQNRYGY